MNRIAALLLLIIGGDGRLSAKSQRRYCREAFSR